MDITTTSIAMQKSRYNKGAAAQAGLPESDFRAPRVNLDDAGNSRVCEIIADALEPAIQAIAGGAPNLTDEQREFVAEAMRQNISAFKLTAGGGFTGLLESTLRADERYASVWPAEAETAVRADVPAASVEF